MARERAARPARLKVVERRPAETPILDLAEVVRLYLGLLSQSRQLQAVADDLRGRILAAMDSLGLSDFRADGVHAVRQVRHILPRLDERRTAEILEREGRLKEAERTVLDPAKARQVLDELCRQGKIRREDLPYSEPREVEALIVRGEEEKD